MSNYISLSLSCYVILLTFIYQVDSQARPKNCMLKFDVSMCYSVDPISMSATPCSKDSWCQRHYNVSYVKIEPYSAEIATDIITTCCGMCNNTSIIRTFDNISQINPDTVKDSHFVFPVLGRSAARRLYGYHFIPLIEPPSLYYFTRKRSKVLVQLIHACLDMWPLLTITLLMVVISGFIGWCMETWFNKEEFPRDFLTGWFEGFWWSFITMTTVGYGDKVPRWSFITMTTVGYGDKVPRWSFITMTTVGYGDKVPRSIPARLFSIVWILIGITTFSMITAMLSAEISKANSPEPPKMTGTKVGALRHRGYDAALVAEHGGILVDVDPINSTYGVITLMKMLRRKEIDGFVLDRYSFVLFYRNQHKFPHLKPEMEFLTKHAVRTEETYNGDRLSYGLLVKHERDFDYLSSFVRDNREVFNTCNLLTINSMSGEVKFKATIKNALFAISGGFFWPSFSIVSVIIGSIACFGIVYEICRRRLLKRNVNQNYFIEAVRLT